MSGASISVVIPTLNEADGIADVISKCRRFASEVIVVDGGSEDGTPSIAECEGARVITELRRGYGLAYLRGFKAATSDVIATADGDGTYPVEVIPALAAQLINENLKFISGARFPLAGGKSMALTNRLGNKVLSAVGTSLWLKEFKDILSGMWVFRRDALEKMNLYSTNWNLSQEIKIEAFEKFGKGFRECHIPYYERVGTPKLSPWKVGSENLVYFFIHRLGLRKTVAGKPRDK